MPLLLFVKLVIVPRLSIPLFSRATSIVPELLKALIVVALGIVIVSLLVSPTLISQIPLEQYLSKSACAGEPNKSVAQSAENFIYFGRFRFGILELDLRGSLFNVKSPPPPDKIMLCFV